MSMVVKNNMSAVQILNTLNKNSGELTKSLAKVSSGMKINSAADDSSAYAISERMRVQLRGLTQDIQNTQNGSSLLRTAEGAVQSTIEILKTMKEKAINAANDTNTDKDRAIIQKEIVQLLEQVNDNALVTFNGKYLLDGSLGGPLVGSAHDSIISFMSYLDTASDGGRALDEAINHASAGRFANKNELVASFLGDFGASASGTDFLKTYCDIDLTNADTGAITGKDAGGGQEKTAESIVPESGSPYTGGVPTGTTTINGLTVTWPTAADYNNAGGTASQDAAKKIATALQGQWLKNCMDLVTESYALNFQSGATVTSMDVTFENDASNGRLAAVSQTYSPSTGNVTGLKLIVNMNYYTNMDWTDENGRTSTAGAGYLDRTIAHEMTHALMGANIKYFSDLPLYMKEGTAELVHGIDDERRANITQLVSGGTRLGDALNSTATNASQWTGNAEDPYSAGYMLLRYMAKQSADSDPMPKAAFQVGTEANQVVQIGLGDMRCVSLGLEHANGEQVSVTTRAKATSAITVFDNALEKSLKLQTYIGSVESRLEFTASNLTVAAENTQATESVIRDADMAKEMTAYTKANVLTQAAQSMLAQANQESSGVLGLLQ